MEPPAKVARLDPVAGPAEPGDRTEEVPSDIHDLSDLALNGEPTWTWLSSLLEAPISALIACNVFTIAVIFKALKACREAGSTIDENEVSLVSILPSFVI